MTTDYLYKTEPRAHQREAFERSRDADAFALLMEQGTGKTKVAIDTAAWNYMRGRINFLLVLCPPGLQRNWTAKEIDKHLPDYISTRRYAWTALLTTKKQERAIDALFTRDECLRVMAINYEALLTEKCKKVLRRIVRTFNVMLVADEAHYIKSASAKRTRTAWRVASTCPVRRILSGTPITQSPLDLYGQFRFLDEDILGFTRYAAFKAHFAVLERRVLKGRGKDGKDLQFDEITGYRNIDELERLVQPYSFRALKAECTDLPPKVFRTRDAEMLPRQRRIYEDLLRDGLAMLRDDLPPGMTQEEALWAALTDPDVPTASAQHAMTLYMRLQQVLGGWLQQDDGQLVDICEPATNPRLLALDQEVEAVLEEGGKVIIWCAFKHQVHAIVERLSHAYTPARHRVVAYCGDIDQDTRWANAQAFQEDPDTRIFVATPDTAGRGIDLYAASATIYYSRSYNYEHRSQSEDRMHRDGFEGESAVYTDIVCPGTVDEKVVERLQDVDRTAKEFAWNAR